jgi:Bacterial Ig-like domain (group 3)/FG-GAP-like repeat
MGNGNGSFRGAFHAPSLPAQSFEDLNGDGKLDFLSLTENGLTQSPNYGDISFQTYLGRGDGSFTPGPTVAFSPITYNGSSMTFSQIDSYTLVDTNGDGRLDLVALPVGNDVSPGFEVALGNADGSFQTPMIVPFPVLISGQPAGSSYQVTGLSSFKRADGKYELIYHFEGYNGAAANPYYQEATTQVVNGNGTFGTPVISQTQTYSGDNLAAPLNVLDVNGDNNPDLLFYVPAVYNSGGALVTPAGLQLILGNADGTFQGTKPLSVNVVDDISDQPLTIADINGDGKPDLVAMGETTIAGSGNTLIAIGIALGNGDGTFQTPKTIPIDYGYGLETLAAADFNGDGTFQSTPGPDNNGGVIPLQPLYLTVQGSTVIADINGDGKPDIGGTTFLINQYGTATAPPAASVTALAASASTITVGQTETLTATVTASSGSATPTDTVTFLDGTTSIGTGTLNAQGVATLSTTALAAGTHSITASYGGDSNFAGSTSQAVSVTVNAAVTTVSTTTGLTASASSIAAGQSVTFTATVKASSGTAVPTGTVTFADDSSSLGTGTLNAQGVATFATSSLSAGTQMITAGYAGDTNFATSTSSAVSVVVTAATAPDFSLTLAPASGSVNSVSSFQTTVTVTPSGGFTAAVSLTCSGLPEHATCVFNPASVTPNGTAATSTLTIQTGVNANASNQSRLPFKSAGGGVALASLTGGGLLGLLIMRTRRKTGKWGYLQLIALSALLASGLMTGCGGAAFSTPKGSSQITITGTSGATTHSATYSLVVQ